MFFMSFNDDLDELARGQWGLLTRQQILATMSRRQLDGHLKAAALFRVETNVYRLRGAPPSWLQGAMAACLAYGQPVALSHLAAARLWEIEGIASGAPEVTLPLRRSGRRRLITTHRAPLPEDQTTEHFGVPVTTVPRTLVDLADVVSPYLLERAIDQAHRQKLTTPEEVAAVQRSRSPRERRARKGDVALRDLLDLRIEHPGVGDSEWVDRAFGWIVGAGLDPPCRQFQVVVNGTVRILDMAYVNEKIAIEFKGFDFHGRRHRHDSDAVRITDLELDGWLVIELTSAQTRDEFLERLRRALALRRPQVG
jgi:hypothetical protein